MIEIVSLHFGSGAGHVFGGLALWQEFKRVFKSDFHFILLNDSPFQFPKDEESLEVHSIFLQADKVFHSDRDSVLYEHLKHLDPDIIIVDTVWFPILPILNEFRAIKVFYSAYMPEKWFTPPPFNDGTQAFFSADDYDLAFTIDPYFHIEGCINIAPVINVHESLIMPPDVIRSILEVPDDRKLALVAHNGHGGEIENILKDAELDPLEYCIRSISSFDDVSARIFPLSHYMSGVDLAVGGCGYHFFYETKFYQIPTLYFPQPRIGNEQNWRLDTNKDYDGPYNGVVKMVEMILFLL